VPPELHADPLAAARRILVMRLDNVGDVILTGPLFRELRRAHPNATLGLLASPGGAAAAPLLPWIDELSTWRPVWQDLGQRMPLDPDRELVFIRTLAAGDWDAVLIATSFNQTPWPAAYAAYLAGIRIRVAFADRFGGSVLSHPIEPPPDAVHQAERNLALLRGLGLAVDDERLEIRVPTDARRRAWERLRQHGVEPGEPVLVVPGASASARRLELERMAATVAHLTDATERPVIVATTPRERPLLEAILAAAPEAISLGDDLSVPEYAALVDAAAVVLCGNSSALHLADALGRPIVVAYAGTDLWSQWAPRSAPVEQLTVHVGCSPCYRIDCPIGNACLALQPADVAAEVVGMLAGAALPGSAPAAGVMRVAS
jgi:ADP-heptose:LPS heptosyltransferase